MLTMIEKAQAAVDEKKAAELKKKLKKTSFTLEDFRDQMVQIRKMGSLSDLIGMIPGLNKHKQLKNLKVDDRELVRIEAIINSMTPRNAVSTRSSTAAAVNGLPGAAAPASRTSTSC